jgi:hypothetical protein
VVYCLKWKSPKEFLKDSPDKMMFSIMFSKMSKNFVKVG